MVEQRQLKVDDMLRPLDWPPMNVEVLASPAQMAKMIARVEAAFSDVQYDSPFRNDQQSDFFEVGRKQVTLLETALARCGVSIEGYEACLEFGCGFGRATIPLAGLFPKVIAADISAPHLRSARENAERCGKSNISFFHVNKIESINDLPVVDCFFSNFVFQHNPPPVMRHMLGMVLSRIRPGGLGYFQISVYQPGYRFESEDYLKIDVDHKVAEMHMLPQQELFGVLDQQGFRTLEVREGGGAGARIISLHLLVQRR